VASNDQRARFLLLLVSCSWIFQFGDEASGAPPTGFIWNKAKDAFCFGLGRFVDGFIVSSKA